MTERDDGAARPACLVVRPKTEHSSTVATADYCLSRSCSLHKMDQVDICDHVIQYFIVKFSVVKTSLSNQKSKDTNILCSVLS